MIQRNRNGEDSKHKPSSPVLHALEQEILPRLQSGAESHLVVAHKKPFVVTLPALPALPGVCTHNNCQGTPVIGAPNAVRSYRQTESLMGLAYVLRGEVDLVLSRRVVTCHAGNFVFFLPRTYSDRATVACWESSGFAQTGGEMLWLYMRPQEVLSHISWVLASDNEKPSHLFIPDNRTAILAELLHEEVSYDIVSPAAPQLLWLIYDRVRRKLKEGHYLADHSSVREISNNHGEVMEAIGRRAQRYVDANLMEHMTLESVAHAVFTSRAHLSREFREHTGETFNAYLSRRRIERAQHLLSTTSDSIKEVAWRAGFPAPDYFTTAFRRAVGSTPSQFRKMKR